ncbi:DUF4382 domain-containing protein [Solitalea sp. MAHUQ-68]|uniref:DUF4382 domain-containing protein n=1 Tax=Solitalea agri TaxID=2953739 RepID=A0A9X2F7M7_9SPHI|nr:DUF4382 domain-containing protein [Solitalea agri]MCO4293866.1 DUF4382 domain-containing protein [Solitalea agri]
MNRNIKLLFLLATATLGLSACSKTESNTAHLQIRMTDAPGNYEEINLNVKEIIVKVNDTTGGSYVLEADKQFNILDFKAGSATPDILVADEEIPTGKIKEVRLVLNETGNTIKVDGQLYDLKIPSGYSSGWKVKLTEEPSLTPGFAYSLVLDFDAAKSVVKTGNGKFILKPVVRGLAIATSGILTGTIDPANKQAKVYAINQANDTVGTVSDVATGYFSIGGLRSGAYKVAIDVQDTTYADTTLNNIEVVAGKTTALGTLKINLK